MWEKSALVVEAALSCLSNVVQMKSTRAYFWQSDAQEKRGTH